MIWLVLAAFAGVAVVGVSSWARSERRKVDAEGVARREKTQMDNEEARLLDKLRRERNGGGEDREG
jgi:hypothetical protein